MPDDRSVFFRRDDAEALKELIPPVLMTLGGISLLRSSRFLGFVLLGACLYDAAVRSDRDRRISGRGLRARRAANRQIDTEMEDSFPASDPPSFSGATAGAP